MEVGSARIAEPKIKEKEKKVPAGIAASRGISKLNK